MLHQDVRILARPLERTGYDNFIIEASRAAMDRSYLLLQKTAALVDPHLVIMRKCRE